MNRLITFYVQGEECMTTKGQLLTVREILMCGGYKAGIDTARLEHYTLQLLDRNSNFKRQWKYLDTAVRVRHGDCFLAIWTGPVHNA